MPRRFRSSGFAANNVEFSYDINGSIAFNGNDTVGYRNAVSNFLIEQDTSILLATNTPGNLDIQFDEVAKLLTLKMSTISFGDQGTIVEAIFNHDLQFISDTDFQALKSSVTSNNLEETLNLLATSAQSSSDGSFITYDLTMEQYLNDNLPDLIDDFDDNGDELEQTVGRHNDWTGNFSLSEGVEIPVANNDTFNVDEDETLNIIRENGVLTNDTFNNDNDDSLTAVIETQASHGNITLNTDGSFIYIPNPNFSGQDTFTYKAIKTIADVNVDSYIGTVTITVNPDNDPPNNDNLNDPIYRFQNSVRPGTYLFAGEGESQGIRQNFPQFQEEGFAFNVSNVPDDDLIVFNRFQNTAVPGTYLYAGEQESQNIRRNFPNFKEEGVAFYAYDANANQGVDFYRFQNTQQLGTYLFVGEEERQNILANFPQFREEGIAFKVDL
jgi:VCBS repeat-containing protein